MNYSHYSVLILLLLLGVGTGYVFRGDDWYVAVQIWTKDIPQKDITQKT